MKVTVPNTNSGYNLSVINAALQTLANELNNKVLYRDNPVGEPNAMSSDLDMNGRRIYNLPVPSLPSEAARLQDILNSNSGGGNVANLITFSQAGVGAVTRTVQAKLEESVSIRDFGAVGDGVTDDTAAFQAAITAGSVRVGPGTYTLSGDISIPSNRKIIVEKGATIINTGGRFTAYAVNNVEWLIDGWVKSIALTTVTSPVGWPAIPGSSYYERGFIEFGGADPYTASAENFKVHGSGKVSGDWTGTPTFGPTIAFITNRKGIAAWNSRNVRVEGIEVFGFHGEAIYAYGGVAEQDNWLFKNNYVHDCNANALNFHGAGIANGLLITQNTVRNCYSGVEASAGSAIDNYVVDVVGNGIWTGEGVGNGPIRFTGNVIKNAGLASMRVSFDALTTHADVFVHDNYSIDPGNYGLYVLNATRISVRSNFFAGGARVSGAYDLAIDTSPVGVVADNVGGIAVGGFYVGLIAFAASPTISHYNNISLAVSSSDPRYGGGVATVASTASMTLPLGSDVFSVTGTNTITSIGATNNAGRKVTLIFAGALTFTDGSNLKLAGNLVTTADDTITLVCDGTNWFEVCRSVN